MKFKRLAAGLFTAAISAFVPVTTAQANEPNLVIFGDSVVANPTLGNYLMTGLSDGTPGSSGDPTKGCAQSPDTYARRAAAKLGLSARDYSCSGALTWGMGSKIYDQIIRAIETGGITPDTRRVIITTGFNDTYQNDHLTDQQLYDLYVGILAPYIQRIREIAPSARIQIVGYPQITHNGHACLLHLPGNIHDYTPFPALVNWERRAQEMQIALAKATGTEFVDLKPSTINNSLCGLDGHRMWSGIVDLSGGLSALPLHLNALGHEHVANVIAAS